MSEEIILVRDNNKIPWGFRLTGGRDFNSPLVISRITGKSIAEVKGLKVGDIITEINNEKTNNMCHSEAQRFIVDGGTFLKLIVLRGSSPVIPPVLTPVRELTSSFGNFERKKTTSIISAESIYSLYEDDSFELLDQSEDEFQEFHEPTEEDINQMMLENAEVLEEKGKNVIGVNFKRFIPKCDFIKDSAVFQVLQEEQVYKELSEKEQLKKCPNKRFSTFLEQPDRPIPKPKPKPKLSTQNEMNRNSGEKELIEEIRSTAETELNLESEFITIKNDSEENECDIDGTIENEEVASEELSNDDEPITTEDDRIDKNDEQKIEDYDSASENEFESELRLIKNTLTSLEQLPSIIQSQLATIQSQIENLTQLKLKKGEKKEKNEILSSEIVEYDDITIVEISNENNNQNDIECIGIENEEIEQDVENVEQEGKDENNENENVYLQPENERTQSVTEETNDLIKNEDSNLKRRPAYPLTPLPRPVVLPGGRIWRKPKDAYNEEFIAETLISQAEVLVGSTLGVNFRKYEPPKLDFSNSAVYKLIHNIESKATGFINRDTIPALQDYYQSPISARHFYCANLARKNDEIETNDDTKSS